MRSVSYTHLDVYKRQVYELDGQLKPLRHYYLGDAEAVAKAAAAVANQGKAK